ncbi:MAG: lactate utilization protein [Treponemataceae bacterium]
MDISEVKRWQTDALGEAAVEALKKNDFDAVYFSNREQAVEFVLGFVKSGAEVGFGGSMTVAALGIKDKAKAKGAVTLDHGEAALTPEQKADYRRRQQLCDLFLCSTNALTLDGMLVNVDGNGNRTNAMTFGPKKVIVVAGVNKIVSDEDAANERIRRYAAPLNNKRLNMPNPCVKAGVCCDCKGKTRICKIYSTLRRKPSATDFTVVIIGEELGF